ncbi:hypothetical protein L7F22_032710 [Adiantum nelumboides]|nr:hypothetical protein [Adiantum nelumboides]
MAAIASTEQATTRFEKFNGKNFALWKWRMRMVLEEKGLWEIVTGGEVAPDMEEDLVEYQRREHLAYMLVCLSLGDGPAEEVRHESGAKEVWDALATTYESRNLANVLRLKRELIGLQMKSSDKVKDHMQRLRAIAAELAAVGEPVPKRELAFMLLNSLPHVYAHLVVTLDGRDEARDLEYIASRLEQEEQRLNLGRGAEGKTALLTCSDWKGKGINAIKQGGKDDLEDIICHFCKARGHIARGCAKRMAENRKKSSSGAQVAMMASIAEVDENVWVIDSAASTHMCASRGIFTKYEKYEKSTAIYLGDDRMIEAIGIGDVQVQLSQERSGVINGVLHVPRLTKNLLSVAAMTEAGLKVIFNKGQCIISKEGAVLVTAIKASGLYTVKLCQPTQRAMVASNQEKKTCITRWHARLGHGNYAMIRNMYDKGFVVGLEELDGDEEACEGCAIGKMHRPPFPGKRGIVSRRIFELVHMDLCGPMKEESLGGASYILTIVDDFSRKSFVRPICRKSDTLESFQLFKTMEEARSGLRLIKIRTDRGGEFTSNEFKLFLESQAIGHEMTPPFTPQLNGVAENRQKRIMEMARCMMLVSGVPTTLWAEAACCANYVINRSGSKAIEGKVPEEIWNGKKPCITNLRVFGCKAYSFIPKQQRHKLEATSKQGVMVGYPELSAGYRIWGMKGKNVYVTRDVVFHEHVFPCKEMAGEGTSTSPKSQLMEVTIGEHNAEQHEHQRDEYQREIIMDEA